MKTNNTNTIPTSYTVTTEKIKCNGRVFKGYSYTVKITDEKHTATFTNGGESSISLENFIGGENSHGSRFYMDKGDNVLHQLVRFGKSTGSKQQKAEMMEFIKSVLHIGIKFTDGVMSYTA